MADTGCLLWSYVCLQTAMVLVFIWGYRGQ